MRKFESIIMSNTEPLETRTLWIKEKTGGVSPSGDNISKGNSIWYFGNQGWTPLFDFNTKYIISDSISFDATADMIVSKDTPDNSKETVDISRIYSVYDGSRDIGENANIVNETGLKKHVESLQSQINSALSQIETVSSSLTNHVKAFDGHVSEYNEHIEGYGKFKSFMEVLITELTKKFTELDKSIETINSTLSTLESSIESMQTSIENLQSKVDSLEPVEP